MRDIDRVQGPNYNQMLEAGFPKELQDERQPLAAQLVDVKQQIASTEKRRRLTGQTTSDSQQTINQLLELKRNADQNATTLSDEQKQALADSLQLFLANQSQTQVLNAELATLNDQQNIVTAKQRANSIAITSASSPIEDEYEELYAKQFVDVQFTKRLVRTGRIQRKQMTALYSWETKKQRPTLCKKAARANTP